jgi:hypothetical protein
MPSGLSSVQASGGRSRRTVVGYRHDLMERLTHAGHKDVTQANAQEIRDLLVDLWTDYKPRWISLE